MKKSFYPWVVFSLAFGLRILLSFFGTLYSDFLLFVNWGHRVLELGFSSFYSEWSDYFPGYIYILSLLAKIEITFPQLPQTLLYKSPAIIADMLTGVVIYLAAKKFAKKYALLVASLYLFNPAIIANSTLWGQADGVVAFFGVAALFFATTKQKVSSFLLAFGALVKPQVGFIAPVVGFKWFQEKGFFNSLGYVILSAVIFILGFIPFAQGKNILLFIQERFSTTANQYPFTSVNAFNFWSIVSEGFWKEDQGVFILGILINLLVLGIIFLRRPQKMPDFYLTQALLLASSFLFLTRMHERHLLPTLAPLAAASAYYPILLIPYILFSVSYVANLYFSYIWLTNNFLEIFSYREIVFFSSLSILSFFLVLLVWLRPHLGKHFSFKSFIPKYHKKPKENAEINRFFKKNKVNILAIILAFSFISRIFNLWYPQGFYFDEVYHAFTAREMFKGNVAAWEWWNTASEGLTYCEATSCAYCEATSCAYEWSHPPLAKIFMVLGMSIFGESSFGWRIPAAILGTGVVFLVYSLARNLFKSESVGLLSAAVFSLDGLPLVMSRIGMNDIYFLFFALLTIVLFLRNNFLVSALALGFAFSSKWTALWIYPIVFLVMFLFKIKPRLQILWFFLLPPAVYLLSYWGFFATGHTFGQFVELQQQMWWYHTGLEATHAYQSQAWAWPFMIRPIWLFTYSFDGIVSNIYGMGNPLVFWLGFISLIVLAFVGIFSRFYVGIFVVLSWFLLFGPWLFSPRIMFFYHYLPAVPFLSIALGWFLSLQKVKVVAAILGIILVLYLFFFPHWTGIFVPQFIDDLYYFFPSWR